MKAFNILYQGCLVLGLAGCMETVTENVYCVTVLEEETCPSIDSVNENTFPVNVCGGTHRKALGSAYIEIHGSINFVRQDPFQWCMRLIYRTRTDYDAWNLS